MAEPGGLAPLPLPLRVRVGVREDYRGGIMKVRDVLRILREDGWLEVRTRGSHRVMKHTAKPGIVVVPGHAADELAPGTLKSISDQAGLEGKL